jgi:hypothetical protein
VTSRLPDDRTGNAVSRCASRVMSGPSERPVPGGAVGRGRMERWPHRALSGPQRGEGRHAALAWWPAGPDASCRTADKPHAAPPNDAPGGAVGRGRIEEQASPRSIRPATWRRPARSTCLVDGWAGCVLSYGGQAACGPSERRARWCRGEGPHRSAGLTALYAARNVAQAPRERGSPRTAGPEMSCDGTAIARHVRPLRTTRPRLRPSSPPRPAAGPPGLASAPGLPRCGAPAG